MVENVLGDLEPVGSDLAIMPVKTGEEAEKMKLLLRTNRGLEAGMHEVASWMKKVKRLTTHIYLPHL